MQQKTIGRLEETILDAVHIGALKSLLDRQPRYHLGDDAYSRPIGVLLQAVTKRAARLWLLRFCDKTDDFSRIPTV